ncbi:hypothetical protein [Streptomyces sp. SP18CS02]|uniref:hypothetical protein n=1 Tax=Streptomyces sp. SP18CS02 TaxID=3002531 RepID=UPI002E7A0060|nr:hypothetical protein [Streptomyces sp. SP18CS02]MEE1751244.1 hypothetical protein [Streptomyces sp. SP18CS02]
MADTLVSERQSLGTYSYVTTREDLGDSVFPPLVSLVGDLAITVLIPCIATALFVAMIRILIIELSEKSLPPVHIVPLLAATAAIGLAFTNDVHTSSQDIEWPFVTLGLAGGRGMNVDHFLPSSLRTSRSATATDSGVSSAERAIASPKRRPLLGWTLTVLAQVMLAISLLALLFVFPLHDFFLLNAKGDVALLPYWLRVLIVVPVGLISGELFVGSFAVSKRGKKYRRIIPSLEEMTGERYLLYLRPFVYDFALAHPLNEAPGRYTSSPFELPGQSYEEFMVWQFRSLGRVIAVGQPGERLPHIGAERGYLPLDDWKDTVSRLIQGAHAVVMIAAPTPSTAWEFTEALRTISPTRLLLLIYDDADYRTFREIATEEYTTRSSIESAISEWPPFPQLPDIPSPTPHTKGILWEFPLEGVLSFDQQYRPHFTRFPATVPRVRHVWTIRRLVRRTFKPVLDSISRLPPAPPVG